MRVSGAVKKYSKVGLMGVQEMRGFRLLSYPVTQSNKGDKRGVG